MIKIEKTEVMGWEAAIRGMRNPMNSWAMSDSEFKRYYILNDQLSEVCVPRLDIGTRDHKLMMGLRNAGTDHRKYLRMITVYCDINAPLYWWKEFDTYKVGTVANSCSTMHKIHAKEFTLDDFSHEELFNSDRGFRSDETVYDSGGTPWTSTDILELTIKYLNSMREEYLDTKDKRYWYQMIQLLPSSYNQKRTVMLNYEVLANMYHSRKAHKLNEWHTFCDWVKTLPYSELIIG